MAINYDTWEKYVYKISLLMGSPNTTYTKLLTFNCKCLKSSMEDVRKLCKMADILALQETWLLPHDLPLLNTVDEDFASTGTSAVDTSQGLLRGRPYGGVAILWRKSMFSSVSIIECDDVRFTAIKIEVNDRSIIVICVYMPTNAAENLPFFTECLGRISAIIEEHRETESVYVLGDFNAHPEELFWKELVQFCDEQHWCCIDMERLGCVSGTHTFTSDAHGCNRWLDHSIVTTSARETVRNVWVMYDVFWSDHLPMFIECDIGVVQVKCNNTKVPYNDIVWGERENAQIDLYHSICHEKLKQVDFPSELMHCGDKMCCDPSHYIFLDEMYKNVINLMQSASRQSSKQKCCRKKGYIAGWNKYVAGAHKDARVKFKVWLSAGKPPNGVIFNEMSESRKLFKSKLKWCQRRQEQIKCDILASHHSAKNFKGFWKSTKKWNVSSGVPVSVGGACDRVEIANNFRSLFTVRSPLISLPGEVQNGKTGVGKSTICFYAKEVASIINGMQRGKSPGHDSLSIEHLRYAGVHLPRVLAMFYTLCLQHSYLPESLMRTVVVPLVKNRTGDVSDMANYRPISLATVTAKVLDSLLNGHLSRHIHLNDSQFGFRTGLSTESAIWCLKRTIQYYTERKTPVYACFLDLSKAFDLVNYDLLWDRLGHTDVPAECIYLLKYWYGNQINQVRWAGEMSDDYRLECGVRQGGLTSPLLFNLYVNGLLEELSSMHVGCVIDDKCVNNICYADDIVLLGPSINALRKLVAVCERYAAEHGLKYNSKKSELLIFKAGNRLPKVVPSLVLGGVPLSRVYNFKYLGHVVTETLKDDMDIERERRALAVRGNMLARRFARCAREVKITLFKAFCQSMYTSGLWVSYTQSTYNTLRVQYNNILRMLLGLPRRCSASGMFAEARTDDFYAVRRKKVSSMLKRVRGGGNGILEMFACRVDSAMLNFMLGITTGQIK